MWLEKPLLTLIDSLDTGWLLQTFKKQCSKQYFLNSDSAEQSRGINEHLLSPHNFNLQVGHVKSFSKQTYYNI